MTKWLTYCLMLTLVCLSFSFLSDDTQTDQITTTSKIVRVALVPVCNLGTVCEADEPKLIERAYFRMNKGVKAFINTLSNGAIVLQGKATPWQAVRQKIRSLDDMYALTEDLIISASLQVDLSEYDMVVLYTKVKGTSATALWPRGQLIQAGSQELYPSIAFVMEAYPEMRTKKSKAIYPSPAYAQVTAQGLGLQETMFSYSCSEIEPTCKLRSLAATDLSASMALKRSLNWAKNTDILSVTKNGVYEIFRDRKNQPRALEIALAHPLVVSNKTFFDRLFIEQRLNPLAQTKTLFYLSGLSGDMLSTAMIDFNLNKTIASEDKKDQVILNNSVLEPRSFHLYNSNIKVNILQRTNTNLLVAIEGLPN